MGQSGQKTSIKGDLFVARDRQQIEARFRSGSRWFLLVGGLSALGSAAIYKGFTWKVFSTITLAMPVVFDAILRKFGGSWLWAEQFYYYCFVISLVMAAFFALVGVFTSYASHTGAFLKLDRVFGLFARIGSAFGMAHLVGSRLLYFSGMVIYILDGLLAFGLEVLLRSHLADLRIVVLMNLAFHLIVLFFMASGFVMGMERPRGVSEIVEEPPAT